MTRKQLIPLVAIAALLGIIVLLKNVSKPPMQLEQEFGLKSLVPDGFLSSDVSKVILYLGSQDAEKVILEKVADTWIVSTRFNAPGKEEKIKGFLDKIKTLGGELRSDNAEVVADYKLGDKDALHIEIFRKQADKEESWLHLLAGKKENYQRSFVRKAGENAVYTVDVNLGTEVGLTEEEFTKPPSSSEWIDKKVLTLKKDDITRVAWKSPDRSLAVEKREMPSTEPTPTEAGQPTPTEKKKEYEWVLAEGGSGFAFKKSAMDALLSATESFEAEDIEDPARKSELGLDNAPIQCEISAGPDKKTVLLAVREKPGETEDKTAAKSIYVMVQGQDNLIYKMQDWRFGNVFKEAKDLLDLPGLNEKEEEVKTLDLSLPGFKAAMAQEDKEGAKTWVLKSAGPGLEFKENGAKDVVKAAAKWKPADYCDAMDLSQAGLTQPDRTIALGLSDGKKRTIAVGAEAQGANGRYAKLNDDARIWVMSSSDVDRIFPQLKSFFDTEIADLTEEDILGVQVDQKDLPWALTKKEQAWTLTVAGKEIPVDSEKIKDYLSGFSALSASGVSQGDQDLVKEVVTKITVTTAENPVTLELGGFKGEDQACKVSGKSLVFFLSKTDIEDLLPPLSDLASSSIPLWRGDQIVKISMERATDPYVLEYKDNAWVCAAGDKTLPVDPSKIKQVLTLLTTLKADEIVPAADLIPEPAATTVRLSLKEDKSALLQMGPEKEGQVPVRLDQGPVVYWVMKADVSFPSSQDIMQQSQIPLDAAQKK